MANQTKATLGGRPLLGNSAVMWPDVPGVLSPAMTFSLTPEDAAAIIEKRGPLDLVIDPGGDGDKLVVSHLYALKLVPSDNEHLAKVAVFDRRWYWPYKTIVRNYNVRRRVGYYRIEANDVPELALTEERFAYAKFSLQDGVTRWTAPEVMRDILGELSIAEAANGGSPFRVVTRGSPPPDTSFENANVDATGEAALAQAMRFMPGLEIRCARNGDIELFNRADGGELSLRAQIGPEIVGGGHVIVVSHANEAPREIHVLVPIECELLFSYTEETSDSSVAADPDEELQKLKPVIALPDYQLSINGQVEAQGTIVSFPDYIAALPALPAGGQLTDAMIRRAFMPFSDLWASILKVNVLSSDDNDWAVRVAGIQQSYRRMFRLPRGWHDRVLAWKPYRVATVNQSTGARAPAVVYADHAILGGMRSQLHDYSQGGPINYAINVEGYATEATAIDSTVRPAPAEVRIYDQEMGVVMWTFLLDPYRFYEQILPSQIEQATMPGIIGGAARRGAQQPISFDTIKSPGAGSPQLSSAYKAAILLTAMPGAPNDSRQFYRIVVKPDDVAGMLPPDVLAAARRAKGPVLEVRVSNETARLRWDGTRLVDYQRLFGIADGEPDLSGLCVNATADGQAVQPGFAANTGAALDELAKSRAARIWASYPDHLEGTMTGALRDTPLAGWTASLVHALYPDGTATSRASFPDRIPEFPGDAWLKPETRAIINREVFKK